ncbi:MAG TPA: hypothetical protein VGJ44_27695 [Kribbellaceae bacterium]
MDLEITGGEQFAALARDLRQAGRTDLRKELYKAINRRAKPMAADVMKAPPKYLPSGYAAVLGLKVKVRKRSGGASPGVRLVGSAFTPGGSPRELAVLNRGRLRHMLFGDAGFWFDQAVKPRFWDEPLEKDAPKVRKELLRAIRDVARRLTG